MKLMEKILGTHSERELKRVYPLVDKIEALGPEMEALSDEELRGKTQEFKDRLAKGETLDDLLAGGISPLCVRLRSVSLGCAITGCSSCRRHYPPPGPYCRDDAPVKVRPWYPPCRPILNALEGKGVHIVTVNDYLAKRDAEWMGVCP